MPKHPFTITFQKPQALALSQFTGGRVITAFFLLAITWSIYYLFWIAPDQLAESPWLSFQQERGKALWFSTLLTVKVGLFLFFLSLFRRYRPQEVAIREDLPMLTVIVPAYNEGAQVFGTLESIFASDYPHSRLDVVAVDDGSVDDTLQWIRQAAKKYPQLSVLAQPKNKGKRAALYRAIRQAKGSIIVTIDSDSLVRPDTLRNLVAPLVLDPNCGAVAGKVEVLNRAAGILPKMLAASFSFSFGFIRAAQSEVDTVLCTPGALSAYRKKAVDACLEAWFHQTFLGRVTTIGEDRAMTNLILKQGYSVKFQANAVVETMVPTDLKGLSRMYTRWERSNVRENIHLAGFVFGPFRAQTTGARVLCLNQWMKMLLALPMFLLFIAFFMLAPVYMFALILLSATLLTLVPVAFCVWSERNWNGLWLLPYSLLYAFTLAWISPYALVTVRNGGWLTRQSVVPASAHKARLPEESVAA
ncbi:glycosyltransferase [Nitritalea halalkaliphila LW7]|uniref:Glycosyltransferase n=1 Tax=Nitritalea halalkaliphila LW7 TaxID=1189621 RepID=I5C4L6_9BACT|nr:glycosyltransferase family 2 protein [Nitritalea halalkaliphila]EIM76768.1 glycosyltransferase [Nitritalea halalkaliphila LW7]